MEEDPRKQEVEQHQDQGHVGRGNPVHHVRGPERHPEEEDGEDAALGRVQCRRSVLDLLRRSDPEFSAEEDPDDGQGQPRPRQADEGKHPFASRSFSVHAATTVQANDHAGLERLCRYINRPPLAYGRRQRLDAERLSFRPGPLEHLEGPTSAHPNPADTPMQP